MLGDWTWGLLAGHFKGEDFKNIVHRAYQVEVNDWMPRCTFVWPRLICVCQLKNLEHIVSMLVSHNPSTMARDFKVCFWNCDRDLDFGFSSDQGMHWSYRRTPEYRWATLMGFWEIWAFMSGRKIQKISPFCPDYIRHTRFSPKFVRIVHQGSKFAKIVRISASGFKKTPRPSGMAYRTVRKPFGFGHDCKLAPPLSFVSVFFSWLPSGISQQNIFPPVRECLYLR